MVKSTVTLDCQDIFLYGEITTGHQIETDGREVNIAWHCMSGVV